MGRGTIYQAKFLNNFKCFKKAVAYFILREKSWNFLKFDFRKMVFSVLLLSTIVQVCDDRDDGLADADADAGAGADAES